MQLDAVAISGAAGAVNNWVWPRQGASETETCSTTRVCSYISHSLNSLKGGNVGEYFRGYYGDARSLDYDSYASKHTIRKPNLLETCQAWS